MLYQIHHVQKLLDESVDHSLWCCQDGKAIKLLVNITLYEVHLQKLEDTAQYKTWKILHVQTLEELFYTLRQMRHSFLFDGTVPIHVRTAHGQCQRTYKQNKRSFRL